MSVKAVLFDLNGTLVERSFNDAETFHRILDQKGIKIPLEKVEKALCKVKKELQDVSEEKCGKIPLLEFHNLWNSHILKVLGIEDLNSIMKEAHSFWIDICGMRSFSDAEVVLTSVRHKGLKTGIVSGAYVEEIFKMLEIGGLDTTFFDIIVGVDTVKKRKPDPEVFEYALRKLHIEPEEAIYVGDDLERDYRAAERVGMNPFLLVRAQGTVPEGVKKIERLIDLMYYL